MVRLGNDWDNILADEWQKPYYQNLRAFLKSEYSTKTIYPNMNDIFNALRYTSFENTKVVIIGQDPYHEPGQAHGLCFSVLPPTPVPPSLQNIYKEIQSDLGRKSKTNGDLTSWANKGVLLLNATLTVQAHQARSHFGRGWEEFTNAVIKILGQRENIV